MKYLLIIILLVSCSSPRPVLYPNNKYKSVGKAQTKKDTDKCLKLADEYVESDDGKKIVKGIGVGAIAGAAIGAVSGIFTGDIGGGAAFGGAVGGTAGGVSGAAESLSPDQLKQRFTDKCLRDKGYRPMGWR